jgi:hypothetical protein
MDEDPPVTYVYETPGMPFEGPAGLLGVDTVSTEEEIVTERPEYQFDTAGI